mgnify:CR=1 FL=1
MTVRVSFGLVGISRRASWLNMLGKSWILIALTVWWRRCFLRREWRPLELLILDGLLVEGLLLGTPILTLMRPDGCLLSIMGLSPTMLRSRETTSMMWNLPVSAILRCWLNFWRNRSIRGRQCLRRLSFLELFWEKLLSWGWWWLTSRSHRRFIRIQMDHRF